MKRNTETADETVREEKISRHTLESDEELDDNEGGILNPKEMTGQEENTIDYDGDIQITPFNMKDELEDDGHFDASGTFIFKKINENGDNWLEDVDWAEVKRQEEVKGKKKSQNLAALNDELTPISKDDRLKLYEEICEFLNPRESVLRALKRLGPTKNKSKQQRNWTRRKDGSTNEKEQTTTEEDVKFARLTELANDLLSTGDYDIYQKTKEVIEDFVTTAKKVEQKDELDSFAEDLDLKVGIERTTDPEESSANKDELKWLMKKGGADADTEVEGPYSNEDVHRWISQKIFADPSRVLVKRQGTDDPFLPLTEASVPSSA